MLTAEQVRRLREDTPGCREVIHFNNAGAALMPRPVIDATVDHLKLQSRIGGYEAADAAEEVIEGAYDAVARLIGAERDELAIVGKATPAWDTACQSLPAKPGDRILPST